MTESNAPVKTSASYLILPAWILAMILGCAMLEAASSIILWIACSFFLMALLDPAAQMMRKKMPMALASLILVFVAMLIAVCFVYLMIHFSAQMVNDLDNSKKMFLHYYRSLRQTYESWMQIFTPPGHAAAHATHATADTAAQTGGAVQAGATPMPAPTPQPAAEAGGGSSMGTELASTVARGLGGFLSVLVYTFLVPVLTFFMLSERDHIGNAIRKSMNEPAKGPKMWERIVVATRAYFVGNLTLGIVSFPILVGLFFAFGVPSPITLAALASVFNLIPFLGAVLSGLLPAVSLLSTGAHAGTVVALYGLCAMFHMILANFVTPKVLGRKLNVNATTSTIALVVLGELLGGVGLLLAIPAVATVKIMFETSDLWWLRWLASIMDEKQLKPLEDKPKSA